MKKISLAAVLTAFCILFPSCMPAFAKETENIPSLSAQAAVLYEPQTQTVLLAKNENKRLPMASTTKIMTALTVLTVLGETDLVTVPKSAVGTEGSSAYLKEGEVLSVLDLLYALLLASANDAAVALAVAADGSCEAFAERMNAYAKELGLTDTHFDNPHGLHSENHYTTAKELAILSAALLKNDRLKKIVSEKYYTAETSLQKRTFVNHNKLLSRSEDAIGIKTGFTKASGRCLVGAASRDGMTLISVTLHAPNDWNDHERMWSFGFSQYELRTLVRAGTYCHNVSVIGALLPFMSAVNREDVYLLARKSDPSIETRAVCLPYQVAPIAKDTVVGYLCFFQSGKEIKRIPLYAATDVSRAKIKQT